MADKKDPNSANAQIEAIHRKHSQVDAPLDVSSTGGIQRTLRMHWEAIKALADRMDGVKPEPVVEPVEPFKATG